MTNTTFIILFVFVLLLYGFSDKIVSIIKTKEGFEHFSVKNFNLIVTVLLVILIVVGMLFIEDPKKKYGNISDNFDKIRTPASAHRPHRYFDIDTYPSKSEGI